jgi:hypothetical protein
MSIITNKEYLVDFDGILRVTEYNALIMPADGLLENQIIIEGFSEVEVLAYMLEVLFKSREHDECLRQYHEIMSAMCFANGLSQN